MLNEDKIRLMNEIARYEKREGRREGPARKYFRGDYVAKHMLQSFFAYTLSFCLFLGVAFLYRLEFILRAMSVDDVISTIKKSLLLYLAGLLLYEAVALLVYRRKYAGAVYRREQHLIRLNRLKKRYDIQERLKELNREGGRND